MSKLEENIRYFTYKDYLKWPINERWEIIDGQPFSMTPAPSTNHQRVLGEFFTTFKLYLKGKKCEVFVAPFDVRLPSPSENGENSSTIVQPDLSIICDPNKIDPLGCVGGPDLIIEVTSPSTLPRDMKYKLFTYEKAGVKEYWIVHPEGKTVLVYQLNEEGYYTRPQVFTNEDELPVGIFSDLVLNLHEIFSIIPDAVS